MGFPAMRDFIARSIVMLVEHLLFVLLVVTDSQSASVSANRESADAARVRWSMNWSRAADRLRRAFNAVGHDVTRTTLEDVGPADLDVVLRVAESAAATLQAEHDGHGCSCKDGCVMDRIRAAIAELTGGQGGPPTSTT
jgi:hypothetical protein